MSFDGSPPVLPGHRPKIIGPGPGLTPSTVDPDKLVLRRAVALSWRMDGGCR